jgi:hypothetical protein
MKVKDKNEIFWPGQLLPQCVPDARVLTFGYDAKIRSLAGPDASTQSVWDTGRNFLNALEAGRRECPNRPIFFIAHSLGGVIVKEMLRRSERDYFHQNAPGHIYASTTGIIFFGTPHAGAKPGGTLLEALVTASKLCSKKNEKYIKDLMPGSERLEELREVFASMARKRQWKIHSFQEGYGMRKLVGFKVNNHD